MKSAPSLAAVAVAGNSRGIGAPDPQGNSKTIHFSSGGASGFRRLPVVLEMQERTP